MTQHQKSWPALIIPLPTHITFRLGIIDCLIPLPVNRFHNKQAPSLPKNMPKNPTFCFFASFSVVSLTTFINKAASSWDLIIFMISFTSPFEIISVVMPVLKMAASVDNAAAAAAAVDSNGIKTLLAF